VNDIVFDDNDDDDDDNDNDDDVTNDAIGTKPIDGVLLVLLGIAAAPAFGIIAECETSNISITGTDIIDFAKPNSSYQQQTLHL
jgi:hypothetical protein